MCIKITIITSVENMRFEIFMAVKV